MSIRNETTSSAELLLDARYHIAALLSDPDTESLAPPVQKAEQGLRGAVVQAEAMDGERVEKQATLTRLDLLVDRRLRQLDRELLTAREGDRSDDDYREVFPRGVASIIAMRGAEEAAAVDSVLSALQRVHPELFKRHGSDLTKMAANAAAAETALIKAEAAADQAFTSELAARRVLVRQMQKNEGALTVLYPGDRAAVRSFFRPTRRRAAETPEAPEPAPTDSTKPE